MLKKNFFSVIMKYLVHVWFTFLLRVKRKNFHDIKVDVCTNCYLCNLS